MRRPTSRPGFTLVEFLVVIGVLAVVIGLAMPAILRAREAASLARCRHNLGQLGLAAHNHDHTVGHLPAYCTGQPGTAVRGGWWIYLMPYMEQEQLHKKILAAAKPLKIGTGTFPDRAIRQPGIRDAKYDVLTCWTDSSQPPKGDDRGMTNYVANWYVFGDGVWGCFTPPQKLSHIEDGLSNTVLFAETYRTCGRLPRPALDACSYHNFGITWQSKPSDDPSYSPTDYTMFQLGPRDGGAQPCDPLRSQSAHAAMPVCMADRSVQTFSSTIDPSIWKQMLKPRDGGPFGGIP